MLSVYRLLINLIVIFSPLIILLRLIKKKEHILRFKEKFTFFSKKRKEGNLLWFHGASVGELMSVIPLIEKLEKDKNIKQILVTTSTLSSARIFAKFKFKKTIHQFFPIDTNYLSKKFLNYWRPNLAIFIDSEIWPNMLTNLKKNSINHILLNARITKKSFKRWKFFSSSARKLFQNFDICLSSSLESKNYLKSLGAKKNSFIGNLKFTQSEKVINELNNNTKKFFITKKIWCASSTHVLEEKICANIHKKLKIKYKNLLTIIIPRHIHRTKKIIKEINELNLKIHLHSSTKKINKKTDIYLVNSFGQTQSFFKECKVVFLGGSIIEHGGQNPLEAVRYGCRTLHGPNIWNFKEIYALLHKYNFSTKIQNSSQLAYNVNKMIKNKTTTKSVELRIKKLGSEILTNTLKEISPYIDR